VVEREGHRPTGPRIDLDANRRRDGIPRRECPLLAFSVIRWQFEDAAVRPAEGLVSVEDRLNADGPGGEPGEVGDRVPEHIPLEAGGGTRREVTDVDAEDLRGAVHVIHVLPRLPLLVSVENQDQPAGDRTVDHARSEPHLEAQGCALRGSGGPGRAGSATEDQGNRSGGKGSEHEPTLDHESVAVAIDLQDLGSVIDRRAPPALRSSSCSLKMIRASPAVARPGVRTLEAEERRTYLSFRPSTGPRLSLADDRCGAQLEHVHHPLLPEVVSNADLEAINFVTNDRLQAALERTTATKAQIAEAIRINTESRLNALKLGLLIMAGLALLTIIPAGSLPDYRPGEIPADTQLVTARSRVEPIIESS